MALAMLGTLLALQNAKAEGGPNAERIWNHENLLAWCVVPFDEKKRSPEHRAQMLQELGFKYFAYDWRGNDIPTFDAEIEALQRHGINLAAWWFPLEADDPMAKNILEIFKRHHVHPQLWVIHSLRNIPSTPEEWQKFLPKGVTMPSTDEEYRKLSDADKAAIQRTLKELSNRVNGLTETPAAQSQRVDEEAERIRALVKLATPYGSKVELYNHNGWFGMEENQLAVIARLKDLGITDVGMVYNFSHSRDELHDDSKDFPRLWAQMKDHVVVVNITGMRWEGKEVYPSQGDSELAMMRTIERSGWHGHVGLIAEKGGDAATTLKNNLKGLDWLATELDHPGSGGPKPFPPAE